VIEGRVEGKWFKIAFVTTIDIFLFLSKLRTSQLDLKPLTNFELAIISLEVVSQPTI